MNFLASPLFYLDLPTGIYKVCLKKVQPLLTLWEWFAGNRCNLAAKASGLECTCVNTGDFTILVKGLVDATE